MYFTPVMMKNNDPIPQESSVHLPILITTILFWAGIAVGAAGSGSFLEGAVVGVIIGITYLIYLITACCCSDIKGYITNLKAFDDYKKIYDGMVEGKGYFSFYIQCYHYETRTDHEGRTHQERVVTHTAS